MELRKITNKFQKRKISLKEIIITARNHLIKRATTTILEINS